MAGLCQAVYDAQASDYCGDAIAFKQASGSQQVRGSHLRYTYTHNCVPYTLPNLHHYQNTLRPAKSNR